MARGRRILGSVIEELIGLSTMLIPEPKTEPLKLSLEEADIDASMQNVQAMKGLLAELRKSDAVTCPKCVAHVDKIEEELTWLEQRVPSYERVARLRRQLRELLDLIKPEAELPVLPEETKEEKREETE